MSDINLDKVVEEAKNRYSDRIPLINKFVFKINGKYEIIFSKVNVIDFAFTCKFIEFKGYYSLGEPKVYVIVDVNVIKYEAEPNVFDTVMRTIEIMGEEAVLKMFPEIRYFLEKKVRPFLKMIGMDDVSVIIKGVSFNN